MKNRHIILLLLLLCFQMVLGQDVPSAVRLSSGNTVTNALIYENGGHKPLSEGVLGNHSASDSMILGTANIQLTQNPFTGLFRIDASSPAFNSGTTDGMRVSDTLDLDNRPRLSCCGMDIGAFEFFDIPTKIISQPQDIRTVLGAQPVFLTVDTEGANLHYRWMYNGADMSLTDVLQTSKTLPLSGTWADTGVYQVMVYGICCNDTSNKVRVNYDDWSLEIGGECPELEGFAEILIDGNYSFLWNRHETGQIIRGLDSGVNLVRITDSENRFIDHSFYFTKFSPIEIVTHSINPDNISCDNGAIQINAWFSLPPMLLYDFYWERNGDFFSSSKDLNNVSVGNYKLSISRQGYQFCPSDTFNFSLLCQYKFSMEPTVITPNGDGLNDILDIKHIEHFPNNTVTIINSYGEIIFQKNNYDNVNVFWDGRNRNGKLVPDGTYYFVVQTAGKDVMASWVVKKTAK